MDDISQPGHGASDEARRRAERAPTERLTIGLLTTNIHMGVGGTLWSGVVDAARAHDCNLLCVPGGTLHSPVESEAQRNVIYELVDPARLAGLVSWASAIGQQLDLATVEAFHRRYRAAPLVTLTMPLLGLPTLAVDSYHGMHDVIAHLIETHKLRRLAFVQGPESHPYAQERYRAYADTLEAYGLPFDPRLVSPPFPWDAGVAALEVLLDERGLRPGVDFEALVTVSDLMALDILKVLQQRGVQVPEQVALVSLNDSLGGRFAVPPLTSVAMPFYEQGRQAVELLLEQLAGAEPPGQVRLPSRMVVRQSCGCPSLPVTLAGAGPVEHRDEPLAAALAREREVLLADLALAVGEERDPHGRVGRLIEALGAELTDPGTRYFLPALTQVLQEVSATGGDPAAWQGAVSLLRRFTLPYLEGQRRALAEDLWGQARVIIAETAQRAQVSHQLQAERQAQLLRNIEQSLITTFDVAQLMYVLAEQLPPLGIASCYLSLYEDPDAPLEYARLVLAYDDRGRVALEPGGRRFPASQLVPEGLLPTHRRHSLVLEPLYFREDQLGFVLFEIGPADGTIYEVLRGQISSALKGALLFREATQARLAAERADQIKTRLLANVSHELRTPLHMILDRAQEALGAAAGPDAPLPPALLQDFQHIYQSAEHQLRLINDLLDLSRAEIDALDLYPELIDPRPLLAEVFEGMADHAASRKGVRWELQLPPRLPVISADPVRLRQILLNLLSNARKFTEQGQIVLGADVSPPHLHLWVQNSGTLIPDELRQRIFEPFVTAEHAGRRADGIGLGLAITRRLIALHQGSIALEPHPEHGNIFHVYLPLPSLTDQTVSSPEHVQPVLLLITDVETPAPEIVELSQRQGLEIRRLRSSDEVDAVLRSVQPVALAWDLAGASQGDWALVRRLRAHPRLAQTAFILYGQVQDADPASAVGLTSFVVKPVNGGTLLEAISAACPSSDAGTILVVDDDPRARERYQAILAKSMPGYSVRVAPDGGAALEILSQETPSLVLLDLVMPELDGFGVLDWMRAEPRLRQVPVLILSGRMLTFEDIKRLEQHTLVTLQSKGLLSEDETIAALNRALFGTDTLPQHTSTLVKRSVAYLHQNYARPLSRWELAQAVGVSEDYLSRVFYRELGLSPWEYLNRYRISQAKELLRGTSYSIGALALKVGFRDQGYFSRVFHKLTGVSPKSYRENPED